MRLLVRQQEQILYKQIPAFILCLYIMKCRRRIVKRTDILTDQRPVRGELVEVLQTVSLEIHIILVCFLSFAIPEKPVLVEVVDRDLLLPNKGAVSVPSVLWNIGRMFSKRLSIEAMSFPITTVATQLLSGRKEMP